MDIGVATGFGGSGKYGLGRQGIFGASVIWRASGQQRKAHAGDETPQHFGTDDSRLVTALDERTFMTALLSQFSGQMVGKRTFFPQSPELLQKRLQRFRRK